MKAQQITYDVSRCYLEDRKGTLPGDMYRLLHGKIRARDFAYLASCSDLLSFDVTDDKEKVRTVLQLEAMFKKNTAFTDPVTSRLAALISFEEGERLCQETNDRLDNFVDWPYDGGDENPIPSEAYILVGKMQRFIERTLGDFSDFLRFIPKGIRVTAGATVTRNRKVALPFLKISKKPVCTPGALPYLDALSRTYGYGSLAARLISVNRVEFVPKSWKTDRTIACEAEGNMFLQLAFDKFCKRRLKRQGINLHCQTRNQELARLGSFDTEDYSYATIDLSMASDTLAYNAVSLLLPKDWFGFLRSVRSQYGALYPLRRETYAKFSSMGNGATFALETLVFAAACYAVGAKSYVVYGDDIVIEQHLAKPLVALLAFIGFVPNESKSFTKGLFRESCGTHWFSGSLVTPRYIREIDKRRTTLCHLVNTMVSVSPPFGRTWEYLRELTLENNLPFVPVNEDSMSGVWVDPNTAYEMKLIKTNRKNHKWCPQFLAYKPKTSVRRNWDSRSLFLWHLGAPGRDEWSVSVRVRGLTTKYKFRDYFESSRNTSSSHKYVRKWVHWELPVVGAGDHVILWSQYFTRESQ